MRSKKAFDGLKYDAAKHSLTILPLELASLKGVKSFARQTIQNLGKKKLDYLLLNAALMKTADSPVEGSKWCEPYIVNHLCKLPAAQYWEYMSLKC